jgi:hypothetical protein
MAGYYTFTVADNGKVLGLPLLQSNGNSNNFVGASATLYLRDSSGNRLTRTLTWNGNATPPEWEYTVVAGEFAVGRWWAMAGVTFAGGAGPIFSTEVMFDVIAAD